MFLGKGLLLPSLTGERWARIAPNTAKECPRSRAHLETVSQTGIGEASLQTSWRVLESSLNDVFVLSRSPSFFYTNVATVSEASTTLLRRRRHRVRAGRRRASAHARGVGGCLQSVLIPWYVWLGVMIRLMYTAIVRKVRSFLLTEIFWYEKVK